MSVLSDTSLRVLQLIGLTLPAIALYIGVLTELYIRTKRMRDRVSSAHNQPTPADESTKIDTFSLRYSVANQSPDFLLCLAALLLLLISGMLLLFNLVFRLQWTLDIGIGLAAAAYGIFASGVVYTILNAIKQIETDVDY